MLQTITTISIPVPVLESGQVEKVDKWLRSVLWDSKLPNDETTHKAPFEIHRLKGRLVLKNGGSKMIQGVRDLFDVFEAPDSGDKPDSSGKIVLIGRRVADFDFERSLFQHVSH